MAYKNVQDSAPRFLRHPVQFIWRLHKLLCRSRAFTTLVAHKYPFFLLVLRLLPIANSFYISLLAMFTCSYFVSYVRIPDLLWLFSVYFLRFVACFTRKLFTYLLARVFTYLLAGEVIFPNFIIQETVIFI